ncbi:MAG: asparagine synthase (glutamine-hydrolyzing) [Gammaproteobacteria bacterium HGW-Gammaproteobacteria-15]|nr:MAG: asparagine synthase (glutamine-hydrolyzing) [Gammaproteobacteria bacterium HGW-Gammaproteobacteria-15]
MCGFSAVYTTSGMKFENVVKMNNYISHRGPDGEGFYLYDVENDISRTLKSATEIDNQSAFLDEQFNVLIGHRRLAIVDLSDSGFQPMVSDDKRYIIAFNGEIYNYQEIKHELSMLGYAFSSNCDTEVLLKAYIEWGESCLEKFNGMFAFQILDIKLRSVFGARDRFGVKPLYYWKSNGLIALASEIKQFTVLPGWKARINSARVYDFLQYGQTDHTSQTLFLGVSQIPPGHKFKFNLDDLTSIDISKWYKKQHKLIKTNLNDAKVKFNHLFKDSIRLRLQADVPVGTGLSGGMDSSSIACEINSVLKEQGKGGLQKTFSAYTEVKKYDERNYMAEVLDTIAAEPHFIELKCPDKASLLEQVVWHQDEPFGTTSIFAEWSVFKLAKTHKVKVTLDGHGADETLAGYHRFFFIYLIELLKKGQFGLFCKEVKALRRLHNYNEKRVFKTILYLLKSAVFSTSVKSSWWKVDKDDVDVSKMHFSLLEESKYELFNTSVPMQLHWCDRDSMAHSVESRAPFLDYRLVEHILSCPSEFKIKEGKTKYLLRESLKGILPKSVYERVSKIGFATPEENWMLENKTFFLDLLNAAKMNLHSLVELSAFDKAEKIILGQASYDGFAWRIICLSIWVKVFNVNIESR